MAAGEGGGGDGGGKRGGGERSRTADGGSAANGDGAADNGERRAAGRGGSGRRVGNDAGRPKIDRRMLSYGKGRSMPRPVQGVQDEPADRQTPGGNPFKMGESGTEEDKREAACQACDEMLDAMGDEVWHAGGRREEGGSEDERVGRQLDAIGRRHGVPVDKRFRTMKARRELEAWLEAQAQRVRKGKRIRLICWC